MATTEQAITKTDNGNGTSLWIFSQDGTEQVRCNDCDMWAYPGKQIRHSKRCDTPTAQEARRHVAPVTQAPVDKPRTANGLSSDELLAAVQRGYLTHNDAMNRDF